MAARRRRIVIALVPVGVGLVALVLAIPAIGNRLAFGTFSTQGPPPRIDYCGRRYYPDSNFPNSAVASGHAVAADLSANGQTGLSRVGTTPSGMTILANVMTPAVRASFHTSVCTMVVWVKTGSDQNLGYSLSGGP